VKIACARRMMIAGRDFVRRCGGGGPLTTVQMGSAASRPTREESGTSSSSLRWENKGTNRTFTADPLPVARISRPTGSENAGKDRRRQDKRSAHELPGTGTRASTNYIPMISGPAAQRRYAGGFASFLPRRDPGFVAGPIRPARSRLTDIVSAGMRMLYPASTDAIADQARNRRFHVAAATWRHGRESDARSRDVRHRRATRQDNTRKCGLRPISTSTRHDQFVYLPQHHRRQSALRRARGQSRLPTSRSAQANRRRRTCFHHADLCADPRSQMALASTARAAGRHTDGIEAFLQEGDAEEESLAVSGLPAHGCC